MGGNDDEGQESEEKAEHKWSEILQEVRVAQTDAQILFGFLISVLFTPRFIQISPADRTLYDVTVVLNAVATGTLIAVTELRPAHPETKHRAVRSATTTGRAIGAGPSRCPTPPGHHVAPIRRPRRRVP
ncbi:DUF6328 family protein [Kitasatospora sp. NPDC056531]|uniref:DUF6328 family protein n=1 Tax=Kitasatospora sp. NPDC056531 TaxID=3345856 RepID=UPI0036854D35